VSYPIVNIIVVDEEIDQRTRKLDRIRLEIVSERERLYICVCVYVSRLQCISYIYIYI